MTHTMSCTLVLHSLGWMLSCKATLAPISWNKNLHRCETAPSLRGSIWGILIVGLNLRGPHWGALNAPRIHTAHFSHETHMWLILLSREGHRIYVMKLCRLLVLYKLDSLEELLTSCLKFRNVNQVIFWHIYRKHFSLLVYFFTEAH